MIVVVVVAVVAVVVVVCGSSSGSIIITISPWRSRGPSARRAGTRSSAPWRPARPRGALIVRYVMLCCIRVGYVMLYYSTLNV